MKNIIINGKESQLPFGEWFLEEVSILAELENECEEEISFSSLEEVYEYFTEKQIKKIAKQYFKEMFYKFEKIENGIIFVTCKYDN